MGLPGQLAQNISVRTIVERFFQAVFSQPLIFGPIEIIAINQKYLHSVPMNMITIVYKVN
jgi:hypothetical protein